MAEDTGASVRQEIEVTITDREGAEAFLRRLNEAMGNVGETADDSSTSVRQVGQALEDSGRAAGAAAEAKKKSYFSLERIGTASMAAAGGLKFATTMLTSTGSIADKVNGSLDSLQMILVGFGPIGMLAAAGISIARTAIGWLTDDADDATQSTMSLTAELHRLHQTMLPAADGTALAKSAMEEYAAATGRAVTQLSLLEELQITQAANAVSFMAAQRRKIRDERLAIEQESIELRRRLSQPYDSGRALQVVTDASRLSYLDQRAKILADLELTNTPFGPEAPAGGLPKDRKTGARAARGPNGSLFGPVYDQARQFGAGASALYGDFQSWQDGRAAEQARADALEQQRYRLQEQGVNDRIAASQAEKRGRGMGIGGMLLDEAEQSRSAQDIITGALTSISSSLGQFVAQTVLAGKMTAKAWREWAAGQLFAIGSDAIGKGIYLELLAGASVIFGLGIASGAIAEMGAALIAGGIGLVAMSKAMGGTGSVPRPGRGGGGGGGGGSRSGGPAAGMAQPGAGAPIHVDLTVGIQGRPLHDAVAEIATSLRGQRGIATVMVR